MSDVFGMFEEEMGKVVSQLSRNNEKMSAIEYSAHLAEYERRLSSIGLADFANSYMEQPTNPMELLESVQSLRSVASTYDWNIDAMNSDFSDNPSKEPETGGNILYRMGRRAALPTLAAGTMLLSGCFGLGGKGGDEDGVVNSVPTTYVVPDNLVQVGETEEGLRLYNAYKGQNVIFNASQSHDIDGEIEKYSWRLLSLVEDENGTKTWNGDFIRHKDPLQNYMMNETGRHKLYLAATDNDGDFGSDEIAIDVSGDKIPPTPVVIAKKDGELIDRNDISYGDRIVFDSSESYDDNEIKELYWKVYRPQDWEGKIYGDSVNCWPNCGWGFGPDQYHYRTSNWAGNIPSEDVKTVESESFLYQFDRVGIHSIQLWTKDDEGIENMFNFNKLVQPHATIEEYSEIDNYDTSFSIKSGKRILIDPTNPTIGICGVSGGGRLMPSASQIQFETQLVDRGSGVPVDASDSLVWAGPLIWYNYNVLIPANPHGYPVYSWNELHQKHQTPIMGMWDTPESLMSIRGDLYQELDGVITPPHLKNGALLMDNFDRKLNVYYSAMEVCEPTPPADCIDDPVENRTSCEGWALRKIPYQYRPPQYCIDDPINQAETCAKWVRDKVVQQLPPEAQPPKECQDDPVGEIETCRKWVEDKLP